MNAKVIVQLINVSKTYAMGEVTVEALKKVHSKSLQEKLSVILGLGNR